MENNIQTLTPKTPKLTGIFWRMKWRRKCKMIWTQAEGLGLRNVENQLGQIIENEVGSGFIGTMRRIVNIISLDGPRVRVKHLQIRLGEGSWG